MDTCSFLNHHLRKSVKRKQEGSDSFHREVQILSRLSHPQLPRIYDSFSNAEHWYLVMTFIEGQTLEQYIKQRQSHSSAGSDRLPLSEVLEMGLELCTVLTYLHCQKPPIIFRDLKPGNILRARTGHLFLIDFGSARSFKQQLLH
jgi:serine/threonine protein kinase